MKVTRKLLKPIRGKPVGATVRLAPAMAKQWEAEGIVAKGEPVEHHHAPSVEVEKEEEAAEEAEPPAVPVRAPIAPTFLPVSAVDRVHFWRRKKP